MGRIKTRHVVGLIVVAAIVVLAVRYMRSQRG